MIGASNDPLEDEADRVADQVLAGPAHPGAHVIPLRIQRSTGQPAGQMDAAPASVDQVLSTAGSPLEPVLRQEMEQRFGHDFSRVRVHSGPVAEQSARETSAHAYTVRTNIVFGAGRFAPRTLEGRRLIAHELTHVVQQSGGDGVKSFHDAQRVGDPVRQKAAAVVQRRETGSGLDDPLYMADRKWSSGQGPDDRITGQKLQNWAIARGSFIIRSEAALKRMQEKDGVESEIVDDIYLLLIDLLLGRDAGNPYDTSGVFVGEGPHFRLEAEQTRLDKFEGSDNARGAGVLELGDHWGPIASYFTHALVTRYRDNFFEAVGRTPKDMTLEEDTEEIKRIRTNPYCDKHKLNQGFVGEVAVLCGQRWGLLHIVDIDKTGESESESAGTDRFWAYRDGHPLWYYRGPLSLINRDAVVGEVARGAAESAQFAAQLFPLIIRGAGLALSFSPNPFMIIASVAAEELGEEGFRDLSGEGRSFKGIASSAAKGILVNLILNKLFGGGAEGREASEATEALDKVAEKAVTRMRDSVEKEIVHTEGPQIAHAIEEGGGRGVTDQTLANEGFTFEVEIQHEGGHHIYRRKADGEWCRWSSRRLCGFDMAEIDEVRKGAIREREQMIAPGTATAEETGMKEVAGVPGQAPVESGVQGTLGEAKHASEVTKRLPKTSKELLSRAEILAERDALLRGDITLREFVERYPPEGVAQVFFPTARGGGRFIDHVYLEESTMSVVFRESKNYRRFSLGSREAVQLEKDLAFLSHDRFKGVRIEWRISGAVEKDTLNTLDKIEKDTNGLFRYVLEPGTP